MKMVFATVGFVAVIAAIVCASYEEAKRWEAFKIAHQCRKVSYERATSHPVTTFGANGQAQFGVVTTPGKTGWACNDGITYYR